MGTFADSFRTAAGPHGVLTFERFMDLALYDPVCGYYRRERGRVGRAGADFYTASSIPLFGELMAEAGAELAGGLSKAAEYTFVELGVEPGGGVLRGISHPFKSLREFGAGTTPELAGPCVVFSNELFDAQPFRRFRKGPNEWCELGVKPSPIGWEWADLTVSNADFLPSDAPEGYSLDAPTGARQLAESIAAQPWTGLFIAADYGKSWEELAFGTAMGTARAYRQHRQTNDLLADPGEQDLTCHVCWDWIGDALKRHGFGPANVEAQEAFFVKHAGALLARLTAATSSGVDPRKRDIMQLLHPSLMGRKFQVMTAFRPP
ncbi:MAG TPA: SAM-dependent methyltransferase [Opitutaceae bacterium]|jgi:SAM-dependent MidA family methyltransferase